MNQKDESPSIPEMVRMRIVRMLQCPKEEKINILSYPVYLICL